METANDKHLVVYLSGVPEVNGKYVRTPHMSGGLPMFRKVGSNIGFLKFEDGSVYVSDCGDEFTPAGVDHLDFYVADGSVLPQVELLKFSTGEDGKEPCPKVRLASDEAIRTLVSALRVAGERCMSNGDTAGAALNFSSVLGIGCCCLADYVSLAKYQLSIADSTAAWSTLLALSRDRALLFDQAYESATYSMEDRKVISDLLSEASIDMTKTITGMVTVLKEKSVYPFLEFLIPLCERLKSLLELDTVKEFAFDSGTVDRLLAAAETRREFQLAGGVEVAIGLREFYRAIELFTFDARDTAVSRMKVFSFTDSFRQYASDGKLDHKGRDGTFKNFWEAGVQREVDPVLDPREQDSRVKDLDPAKEMKCSVIKSITDSNEGEDATSKFERKRKELLSKASREFTVSEINQHDCNNTELKLISIHGVVFDVTHNLEKYAPDGEYFFFPGHDISYPLAVSSLSGDHVDELYRLESLEHLKRVYGWMEYFENKYAVVGRMKEYENESKWDLPPQGEDEPDMQCTVM